MKKLDITTIQEQEGLLRAIENTDICMFWYYPKEKLIRVNDRTADMYRCKKEYTDMPKSFADDFVHPSTQDAFYEMYRRINAGEQTAHSSFASIDLENWCTVTLTTISADEHGRPERVYGIVQNISKLKLQEMEYFSNRRMLSDIISALSKIYIFNYYINLQTGEFSEIVGLNYITEALGKNGSAARAFRRFRDTLIENNYRESFEEFTNLDTLADRIGEKQNISLEYCSIRKGWCRSSFIVVNRDASGKPIQVEFVVENISAERKKELEAREELERAYEVANKANASKSAFLNNMSHDIRTPMNAIVGFAAIASAHIDDKERVLDCIAKITASSKHLLSIINEVLDMSRIESGKIHIQEQETNLPGVLHDFMNMIWEQTRTKGLELYVDTMNLIHEDVYADEARLHRILLNLVGNAVKFTPAGGRISVRLSESSQDSSDCGNYVLTVQDTGIGMGEDFLPYVFEPFEREQTSTVTGLEGTGLGMPITKNIIEMMGGSISVASKKGQGTVFTIELPLKFVKQELTGPKIQRLAGLSAMAVNADDNACDSVAGMLDKIGMIPVCCQTGQESVLHTKLAMEQGKYFAVYIIDRRLPDMDGWEIVRKIQCLTGGRTAIYILTAYDTSDMEQEAKESGVTIFCQKPLFLSQLRTALLTAIGDYEEHREEPVYRPGENLFGKKVLLVEDNELNRGIAVEILTEEGLIVDTAENGKAAVDRLASAGISAYDMVLMDIQMPVMDGYEATREIRAMPSDQAKRIPILAMTANAFEEDKKKALDAGMDGHLAKPIDIDKLLETLDEIFGRCSRKSKIPLQTTGHQACSAAEQRGI